MGVEKLNYVWKCDVIKERNILYCTTILAVKMHSDVGKAPLMKYQHKKKKLKGKLSWKNENSVTNY